MSTGFEQYVQSGGQRVAKLLSALGRDQHFVDALSTQLGQEILQDSLERCERLLTLIYEEKATQQELAEFRVLKDIMARWTSRINAYSRNLEKLTKETK